MARSARRLRTVRSVRYTRGGLGVGPGRSGGAPSPLSLVSWRQAFWAGDPLLGLADGASVSSWRDAGALGSPAIQGTPANQPTFRASTAAFGGRPTVQFDGGDLLVSSPAGAAQAQPISVVVVGQVTDLGTGSVRLFCDGISAARMALGSYQTGTKWRLIASSALDVGASDTSVHLLHAVLNGASSQVWEDNTSAGTGTTGAAVSPTGMTIGASYLGGNQLVGCVAFIGWYVGDITAAAGWAQFKQWVRSHYGLTVA